MGKTKKIVAGIMLVVLLTAGAAFAVNQYAFQNSDMKCDMSSGQCCGICTVK